MLRKGNHPQMAQMASATRIFDGFFIIQPDIAGFFSHFSPWISQLHLGPHGPDIALPGHFGGLERPATAFACRCAEVGMMGIWDVITPSFLNDKYILNIFIRFIHPNWGGGAVGVMAITMGF